MILSVLDLFSGIGGFSLGLERTGGFRTEAFCEIDQFCRRVLAKHWPEVPCYDDVRTLTAERLRADGIAVDAICGGFPCQDISLAGAGAGIDGTRSGLWSEFARIIGELRPQLVLVENVAALLSRGLDRVLGDLAALGYDAEWHCIPASAVGAPHRRDRVWVVAHACRAERGPVDRSCGSIQWADSLSQRQEGPGRPKPNGAALANADGSGWSPRHGELPAAGYRHPATAGSRHVVRDTDRARLEIGQSIRRHDVEKFASTVGADWWAAEPDVGRVAHGVPARVDRLKGLGNAVVPQIPEMIGRAILASLQQAEAA